MIAPTIQPRRSGRSQVGAISRTTEPHSRGRWIHSTARMSYFMRIQLINDTKPRGGEKLTLGVGANMSVYLQSTSSTCLGPSINDVHANFTLRGKLTCPKSGRVTRGGGSKSCRFVDMDLIYGWLLFAFLPPPEEGESFIYLSTTISRLARALFLNSFPHLATPGSLRFKNRSIKTV